MVMTKQRGQALIEFALMTPLICLMIFGMIYGAVIFMDYLNFSNDARTVARQYAVMSEEDRNNQFADSSGDGATYNKTYENKFASFYNVTRTISLEPVDSPVDVVVKVDFVRSNNDLPNVLRWIGFPPEKIRPIEYRMKLEYKNQNQTT